MPATSPSNIDKAAVLLTRLEPAALDKVLELLGPEYSTRLRPAIEAVTRRSDFASLAEQVLQEFRELQEEVRASVGDAPAFQQHRSGNREALLTAQTPTESSRQHGREPGATETSHRERATSAGERSNSLQAMTDTPPEILVAALKNEPPRIIAIVLKQLPSDISGRILEKLEPEKRQSVFVFMADKSPVNPGVVQSLLQTMAKSCRTIDPSVLEENDRQLKTLTGILQAVEREERIRLMETLAEHDAELAAKIDDSLYDYADILRIEDRSVQKLLSQLEQKVVAVAMKNAPENLRQKVMKNLSERVRATLAEEMELLGSISASKAEQARREIANTIRTEDKAGSITWLE